MSSSEPKPEPLLTKPIDDTSVKPHGYDPLLKHTVLEHIEPEEALPQGTRQRGMSPLAGQQVSSTPELVFTEPESISMTTVNDLALQATSIDHHGSSAALAETQMGTNASGEVEIPEQSKRTTVLPKAVLKGEVPTLHLLPRERYEQIKDLGEGAAGDVLLARDNDIQRLVALKRLKRKHHIPTTLARFVEEIQTVGQLEHPHIVPIHDVGVDENGLYYFVMKYVEGETLASIIEKLKAGDQDTHRHYTFDVRNQIFLKVLQAVQFAHRAGIIHRDLKPENIMVGSCGQVMVMDWGIAKRIPSLQAAQASALPKGEEAVAGALQAAGHDILPEGSLQGQGSTRERLFETQLGTMIGTPAYMPPEQALGKVDQVDGRSDIYSLCALYYEWMSLEHYLGHKTSIKELLWGILQEEPLFASMLQNPHQSSVPAEFGYFMARGLRKEPAERYQSIEEMEECLQLAIAGKFDIHCPITLMKRSGNETLRFIDRFPTLALLGMGSGIMLALLGAFQLGYWVYQLAT